jgi:drug/metabolite transporter (DMT)-like permease
MPRTGSSITRPLEPLAALLVVGLCLSWGFTQVAVKVAMHEVGPVIQAALRSAGAVVLVGLWSWWRGIPLTTRDGTLLPGLASGVLFAIEFLLIYRGLLYTTASRAVLFVYLAPFLVVIGARWFFPADRFRLSQWLGLALSFVGIVIAFGLPTPAADPRQMLGDVMMIGAAMAWAATTLVIKASALNRIPSEKTMLYQLLVSTPLLALGALLLGETATFSPSALTLASLAYQTIWLVSITYVIWFAMILRYSASRLSAFTFLTPLFGVASGHLLLNEPLTPAFAAAVVLVAGGLILVNRAG